MNLTRRWTSGAVDDLETAVHWYDERQPGLGSAFVTELLITADATTKMPFVLRTYEHPDLPTDVEFRKIQLKRFSNYALIYAVADTIFWIVAVAHDKREPGYWANRLAGSD